jgi:hypothetical protein
MSLIASWLLVKTLERSNLEGLICFDLVTDSSMLSKASVVAAEVSFTKCLPINT